MIKIAATVAALLLAVSASATLCSVTDLKQPANYHWPTDIPDTRRTTSPTSQPNVIAWYPCFVPGSHHGGWAAA